MLNRPDQAEETISKVLKLEPEHQPPLALGMKSESYIYIIHAKVELALGRFENAVEAARQAHILDPLNDEVTTIEEHVHMVKLARDEGDNMFCSGKYIEASEKYLIGLNYAWHNIVLLCKLATCHFRLGLWEKCIKNFDNAFKFSQNSPVAPRLFANPFAELEKRDQSMKDYEEQVALKASLGVEVNSIDQYKDAISASGPIIIFFMDPSKAECIEFSSFVESLCTSFPSANFLKLCFLKLHPSDSLLLPHVDLVVRLVVDLDGALGLTGLVILSGTCRVAWILPCCEIELQPLSQQVQELVALLLHLELQPVSREVQLFVILLLQLELQPLPPQFQ